VGARHRQVDAGFVDEEQARSSPDAASTQEAFALFLDLGPVGFGGVESLFFA